MASSKVSSVGLARFPDPEQGPKAASASVILTAGIVAATNLFDVCSSEQIDNIQTIFIDNSSNAGALTFWSSVAGIKKTIPPGSQAILPLEIQQGDTIVNFESAASATIRVAFYNVPLPSYVSEVSNSAAEIVALLELLEEYLAPPANAAVTSVAAAVVSTQLLAANANRRAATIQNDSASAILYVKFGAAASTTSYTVQIPAGGYYEAPGGYTGIIHGIWSAAVGNARITEVTI